MTTTISYDQSDQRYQNKIHWLKRKSTFRQTCCNTLLLCAFTISSVFVSNATNLVEVLPVTNKIVQLKFVDGQLTYHGIGQTRTSDAVTMYPGGRITPTEAAVTGIYSISSSNDGNYSSAQSPTLVNVNQRAEQGWDWLVGSQKYVQTTYTYLTINAPLVNGKTYTITVNSGKVNTAAKTLTFTFDTKSIRSEAVHVNNLGYVPSAQAKYGYVYLWMGDKGGLDLTSGNDIAPTGTRIARILKNADKSQVFTCNMVFRKPKTQAEFGQWGTPNNNFLGSDSWECDFSTFNTPGTYVLSVDEIGCSFPFDINNDIYKEPFYWTMKSLYENRSGIDLKTPYAQYNRPAPHRPGVTPGFKLYYTNVRAYDLTSGDAAYADTVALNAGIKGEVNTWGWYQDAGDWDSYNTHAKIPAYLMFLFESNPAKFATVNLDLEGESSNNIPDVLDEARWLIRFYKRSKDAIQTTQLGGTGGVPGGRVFGDDYPTRDGTKEEDGVASWQDVKRKWVMTGEDVWMTYTYAALAAHYACVLQANGYTDPEGINWRTEAENAWTWAQAHQTAADEVVKYEYQLGLRRMYAAAALYRLTGNKSKYETVFTFDINNTQGPNNWSTGGFYVGFPDDYTYLSAEDFLTFPYLMYQSAATVQSGADVATKTKVVSSIKGSAGYLVGDSDFPQTLSNRATRWGGAWYQNMGVGQGTTPFLQLVPSAISAFSASDPATTSQWLKNMYTTADYFLGTNPLNMTYISGLGERSVDQFFHMDSWYATGSTSGKIPKKGFIPYGELRDCFLDLGSCWPGYPGAFNNYYGYREGKAYPMGSDDIASGSTEPARPGHERYMQSRTSPMVNEFTVHQNAIAGALTYGYLWAQSGTVISQGPDNTAPSAPTNLSASNIAYTSFTLNWTIASDNVSISGYDVYIGSTKLNSANITTTTFNVTDLVAGTTYSMTVKAKDAAGNVSAASSTLMVTTSAVSGTTTLTNILDETYTGSRNNHTGFVGYRFIPSENIYVSALGRPVSGGMNFNHDIRIWRETDQVVVASVMVSPTSQTLAGYKYELLGSSITLISGTAYRIASAETSGGDLWRDLGIISHSAKITITNGVWDNNDAYPSNLLGGSDNGYVPPTFFTGNGGTAPIADTQPPTIPAGLSSSAITQTSFTLNWTASTDNVAVTSYEVFKGGVSIGTATNTSFAVTGLTARTGYSMTVKAKDAAGNISAASGALNVSTTVATSTSNDLIIYGDALQSNWSVTQGWAGTTTLNVTSPVKIGSNAIKIDVTGGYGAGYLDAATPVSTSAYAGGIKMWINGGVNGAKLLVMVTNSANATALFYADVAANTWQEVGSSWTNLNGFTDVKQIRIGDRGDGTQAMPFTFYVDQIRFVSTSGARESLNHDADMVDIFPNPANESFFIDSRLNEKANIIIFNNMGIQSINTEIQPMSRKNIMLDKLQSGMYTVIIKNNNSTIHKKLIVE